MIGARATMLACMLACGCGRRAAQGDARPAALLDSGVQTFGIGRTARQDEIDAWRGEVLPDGTGLPDGRGTPLEGAAIYAKRCADCHGSEGQGAAALPLVGGGSRVPGYRIGRASADDPRPTWVDFYPYATTLFDYTRRAMPWNAPGSLSDDETYAVVAWMLSRNGLLAASSALDRGSLLRVELPARARLVDDDRGALPAR